MRAWRGVTSGELRRAREAHRLARDAYRAALDAVRANPSSSAALAAADARVAWQATAERLLNSL